MAGYSVRYAGADNTTAYSNIRNRIGLTSSDISDDVLNECLEYAETEIDKTAGRRFDSGNSVTEYFSGSKKDIMGNDSMTIILSYCPVQSITQFIKVDSSGSTDTTYTNLTSAQIAAGTYYTSEYWIDPAIGRITFTSQTFSAGFMNFKIAYTYGQSTVPVEVKALSICLSGIRAWLYFLGGNYDQLNSYSLPEQSYNKGDFSQRGKAVIDQLTEEAERLWKIIGKRSSTMFFSYGFRASPTTPWKSDSS